MPTSKEKLKDLLKEHKHDQNDLADLLGISYQSVSTKMNSANGFKQWEIDRIAHTYGLCAERLYDIFFSLENLAKE